MFIKEPLNPHVTLATITPVEGERLYLKVRKYNPFQFEVYKRIGELNGRYIYESVMLKNPTEGILDVIERMWPDSRVEFFGEG